MAAIRMAANGPMIDPKAVAQWLYRFGTAPCGPTIGHDFGKEDDPMGLLGLTQGGPARRLLETTFEAYSFPAWYAFELHGKDTTATTALKLYVSPAPRELPLAFPVIAKEFARLKVRSFKVGRGIEGLLRSDKIVAHFEDREHMEEVAQAIALSLPTISVQGVPFTEEARGNGLLSFGVDPPYDTEARSWRSWLTKRLANGLISARSGSPRDRIEAALDAMRSAGVDPLIWKPASQEFWKEGSR